MKTIIVATDFSAAASNAVNYAADMAAAIGADLLLLHVYQLPVNYSDVAVSICSEDISEDWQKELDNLKEQIRVKYKGKLNIGTQLLTGITFYHELKASCESINPYVVVMGSQGTTAAERLVFGGHTVYAMEHLEWPLITVPVNAKFSSVKKIGLACDLNRVTEMVPFEEIKILVNDFNAQLHILNIDKHYGFNPRTDYEGVLLEEMTSSLKPVNHFLNNKNIDESIMDFAEENEIDLLIVLPGRHGLAKRLIHKSHTKQLVLHSHVPVMALHQ